MTQLTAAHGFNAVRVTDLIRAAGVAKPRFYELFESKVGCFLALIDQIFADAVGAIAAALDPTGTATERVGQGMQALVGFAFEQPQRSRLIFVEGPTAGREALDRITAGRAQLAQFYIALREESRRHDPSLPPMAPARAMAIVGAISEIIAVALSAEQAVDQAELAQELTEIVSLLADASA